MKIAICMQCPLMQHGGVEVLVRELIKGLYREFELYLISRDSVEGLVGTPYEAMLNGIFSYDPAANRCAQARAMAEWGRKNGIELFHFHHGGTYGWGSRHFTGSIIPAVRREGFRCVSTNHGAFGLLDCVGAQRSLAFKLAALCLCWPAKIRQLAAVDWEATVSQHDLEAVRRWFPPARKKFFKIYHSVLDGTDLGLVQKKNVVLCLGTVGYRKGQQYLVDAFGRIARDVPGWELVIAGKHAGDGTPDAVHEAIRTHDIADRVKILQDVPDTLAGELLQTSAVFAMPSVAEGLGLSLQEAMFYGAACVGSSVGGITDMIIDNQTGLLVPSRDPQALASALKCLINDQVLRERLATSGKNWIASLGMTRQEMCKRYTDLYRRARL